MLTTFLVGTLALCLGGIVLDESSRDEGNDICNYKELKNVCGNGVKLSENVQLSPHQCNEHILMIAPSGSGKSRRFMMPNVSNLKDCSIIITDPSAEIEYTCKEETKDKNIYIFNPFNPSTIGYDPLANCANEFEVRKIAKVILKNGMSKSDTGKQQEWVDMATPLFTAYLLMNYYTKQYTFDELIKNITTRPILPTKRPEPKQTKPATSSTNSITKPKMLSILEEIMLSGVNSAILELQMFLQVMGAPQTLSSIRIVMNTCLQMFMDDNLYNIFHNPQIDLSIFRREESVLYIQIPERHSDYYAPLTATFITQLLDTLLDNKEGLQIYLMFDEFTNVGEIPNICKTLATARKYRIAIIAAIQSLTQLVRVYGETEGHELRELFKTIMVCAGLRDSAEYISKILGSRTDNKGINKPLLTEDEIRRMESDEVLIICNNKKPVKDTLNPIYVGAGA